jgi:predicted transcriptional regulator
MADKKRKGPKKLERHFKGVANHRRIQILLIVARRPAITLDDIVEEVNGNMKTIAEHTRRLMLAGLIEKTYAGRSVQHALTPYGRRFTAFINDFSNA